MHRPRQLHLRLQTKDALTLSVENERELIVALADLILVVAKANAESNSAEKGGTDEWKAQ